MASGQLINLEKSTIFYSRNTVAEKRSGICRCLANIKVVTQAKYLGLLMVITRTKNKIFYFVKQKVNKKLQGWKANLLSSAGREVLLKAVAMALPMYAMSCFRLPKNLCNWMSSRVAEFWWGSKVAEKRLLMSWKRLTQPKESGGLGFKDLYHQNTALLTKQLWRILSALNLLVSKILKARYFPRHICWMQKQTRILLGMEKYPECQIFIAAWA